MKIQTNRLVLTWILISSVFFLISCSNTCFHHIEGRTMGTTYNIKYKADKSHIWAKEIDSILKEVNNSLSTYIPASTISRFNFSDEAVKADAFFEEVFLAAKEVYELTDGAFDPTVMPLVNAWGFGFEDMANVDSSLIDSLLQFTSFSKVQMEGKWVTKEKPGIMLDFAAIAKGYGVDIIADFFESKAVKNYMVEIGGEVRVKGRNHEKKNWVIGLEIAEETISREQHYKAIIHLSDKSIATSGNYRNFYYKDGLKYAHTIDPKNGYPALNDMLSATVIHKSCMMADALATAFMVMGKEKALALAGKQKDIMVYFVYRDEKGKESVFYSEKLKNNITYLE